MCSRVGPALLKGFVSTGESNQTDAEVATNGVLLQMVQTTQNTSLCESAQLFNVLTSLEVLSTPAAPDLKREPSKPAPALFSVGSMKRDQRDQSTLISPLGSSGFCTLFNHTHPSIQSEPVLAGHFPHPPSVPSFQRSKACSLQMYASTMSTVLLRTALAPHCPLASPSVRYHDATTRPEVNSIWPQPHTHTGELFTAPSCPHRH